MRAVAGSILIHAAVVLVAAVLLSSRLGTHPGPDDGLVNMVLIVGGLALGLLGLGVFLGELATVRRSPPPAD